MAYRPINTYAPYLYLTVSANANLYDLFILVEVEEDKTLNQVPLPKKVNSWLELTYKIDDDTTMPKKIHSAKYSLSPSDADAYIGVRVIVIDKNGDKLHHSELYYSEVDALPVTTAPALNAPHVFLHKKIDSNIFEPHIIVPTTYNIVVDECANLSPFALQEITLDASTSSGMAYLTNFKATKVTFTYEDKNRVGLIVVDLEVINTADFKRRTTVRNRNADAMFLPPDE